MKSASPITVRVETLAGILKRPGIRAIQVSRFIAAVRTEAWSAASAKEALAKQAKNARFDKLTLQACQDVIAVFWPAK